MDRYFPVNIFVRQIRNPPERNQDGKPVGKACKSNTIAPSDGEKTITPPSGQSKNKTITPPVRQNVSAQSKRKEVKSEGKPPGTKIKKEKGNQYR